MAGTSGSYGQLIAVAVTVLFVTYISVFLRCFVRIKITKSFQADDCLILVAQAIFTVSCSFVLRGIHYGLGKHDADLSQESEIQVLKYLTLGTASYVADMMFIKLSIAVFLLRIAVQPLNIWILRGSMVVVSLWSTATFLYEVFKCKPVEAQWNFTIEPSRCAAGHHFVAATYAFSVMTIVTDWFYALLPIPMLWNVKMSPQKKFSIFVLLSLGVFASVATLIRLQFLTKLGVLADILSTNVGTSAMIWTLVEPGIAITAASLVTIRPLLRALNVPGFESRNPSTGASHPQGPSARSNLAAGNGSASTSSSHQKSNVDIEMNNIRVLRSNDKPQSRRDEVSDTSSEVYILEGIRKTVDFSVSNAAL